MPSGILLAVFVCGKVLPVCIVSFTHPFLILLDFIVAVTVDKIHL